MKFLKILKPIYFAVIFSISSSASAHPDPAASEMTDAANAFLATLKPDQKAKAIFKLDDNNRTRWHFVPTEMHSRNGLSFREMQQDQQHMAYSLLASIMSVKGLQKSAQIMSLEQILNDANPVSRFARDPKWYFLSFFGKPSTEGAWGWRFEGHHLSLSFTVLDGHIASITPSFWGTNPGKVLTGPRKGLQVLANEENYARTLAKSFTEKQKAAGIVSEKSPGDIITKANRKATRLEPLGISASKMKKKQVTQLWTIIEEYLRNYRPDIADEKIANLEETDLKNIHFGWAGSLKPGEGHYYRIQAPDFLIEYDNTQGGANHVHCVIRDLKNDFGDDLLRQHHEKHHSN